MRRSMILMGCVAILGAALACNVGDPGAVAATVTALPTVSELEASATSDAATAIPTVEPSGQTPYPSMTPNIVVVTATTIPPTAAPTTAVATAKPVIPTPTRVVQVEPTTTGVSRVQIYLVAVGDAGQSGPMIGCQDSMIAVDRDIAPTRAPLTAALNELLSIKDEFYGQSGLRNALHASNLTVDGVAIDANGLATIYLKGTVSLSGECEDPRFEAQIVYTAKQFATVKDVAVFINGTPMHAVVGGK